MEKNKYYLIGFVNQFFTPYLNLGVLDIETASFYWIFNKDIENITNKTNGVNGIIPFKDKIIIGYQSSPTLFVIYNKDFTIYSYFEVKEVSNLHSFCLYKDKLLTVASGFDEIVEIELDNEFNLKSFSTWWKHPSNKKKEDIYHINSICVYNDDIYISCFGHKPFTKVEDSTRKGQIINISNNKVIVDNLHHPHTVYSIDGELFYCESATSTLKSVRGKSISLTGYTRGISHDSDHIFIGSSGKRLRSRTQGTFNIGWGENYNEARSYIYIIDKNNLQTTKKIELSKYGNEIFEISPFNYPIPEWAIENQQDQIFYFEKRIEELVRKIDKLDSINKSQIVPYQMKEFIKKIKRFLLSLYPIKYIWFNLIKSKKKS